MAPSWSVREISVPSVSHSGMKEWPVPATRTLAELATSAASSASVLGRSIRSGLAETLPDQFCHSAIGPPQRDYDS